MRTYNLSDWNSKLFRNKIQARRLICRSCYVSLSAFFLVEPERISCSSRCSNYFEKLFLINFLKMRCLYIYVSLGSLIPAKRLHFHAHWFNSLKLNKVCFELLSYLESFIHIINILVASYTRSWKILAHQNLAAHWNSFGLYCQGLAGLYFSLYRSHTRLIRSTKMLYTKMRTLPWLDLAIYSIQLRRHFSVAYFSSLGRMWLATKRLLESFLHIQFINSKAIRRQKLEHWVTPHGCCHVSSSVTVAVSGVDIAQTLGYVN